LSLSSLDEQSAKEKGREDNPEALQGFHAEHLLFLIDEADPEPSTHGTTRKCEHTRATSA
jgi:hypothetical protein